MLQSLTSTITSKGQITLPMLIRQTLGVTKGDTITFLMRGDTIEVRTPKYTTMAQLQGAAGKLSQPKEWGEIKQILHDERADIYNQKHR